MGFGMIQRPRASGSTDAVNVASRLQKRTWVKVQWPRKRDTDITGVVWAPSEPSIRYGMPIELEDLILMTNIPEHNPERKQPTSRNRGFWKYHTPELTRSTKEAKSPSVYPPMYERRFRDIERESFAYEGSFRPAYCSLFHPRSIFLSFFYRCSSSIRDVHLLVCFFHSFP